MTESAEVSKRAVVTGASSGIGAAAARRLRAEGWDVLGVARRADRLEELARECGAEPFVADLTRADDVERLGAHVAATGGARSVVNVAGGAIGVDRVEHGAPEIWARMYEINVLSTLRVTQVLLPLLRAGGGGDIVVVTSTAGHDTYPGGGGYVAAKHAERTIANTLRLELVGEPIRVIEIAPGMVHTEEFSLNRLHGDHRAAASVYAGVDAPLVAEDVADAIVWAITRPAHVNVDSMILRPRAQASNTVVARQA
jgi:NADP-dependent 3-hydroxy acid dehydrogenase YdfG